MKLIIKKMEKDEKELEEGIEIEPSFVIDEDDDQDEEHGE